MPYESTYSRFVGVIFIESISLYFVFRCLISYFHNCVPLGLHVLGLIYVFRDHTHREEFVILTHELVFISSLHVFEGCITEFLKNIEGIVNGKFGIHDKHHHIIQAFNNTYVCFYIVDNLRANLLKE